MKNFDDKLTQKQIVVIAPGEAGSLDTTSQETVQLATIGTPARNWGWFPVLSLVSALGLLMIATSYNNARDEAAWAPVLFWIGLLTIFVPIALRFTMNGVSRAEGLGLVSILGLGLYMVKVLHSPLAFTFHDEFVHLRTTFDIIETHHLFSPNPDIPVSPLYPGLHIVTSAVANLSGLDVFAAGSIVLGVSRLLMILSLYLFFEEVSHSQRIAGLACLIYVGNSNFVFFSAQFAYESLALPLVVFVLYVAVKRARNSHQGTQLGLNLAVIIGILATVVTHHLTAYALMTFLTFWTLTAFVMGIVQKLQRQYVGEPISRGIYRASVGQITILWRRPTAVAEPSGGEWEYPGSGGAVLLAFVASLSWLVYIATLTVGYLAPVLSGAFTEIIRIILGETSSRQLFKASTGQVAPLWEQLTGFGAVGLILLGLPFGLWRAWRGHRRSTLIMAMAAASVAYPASLAFRLTSSGWEVSNRTSEFIFVVIGFVVALGFVELWWRRPEQRLWKSLFVVYATIIFVGGLLVGWPPYARMPGPYLVEADTRSVEPQSVNAAQWARDYLGPNNRFAADRINALLMLSYGRQREVMSSDKVQVSWFYLADQIGKSEREILHKGQVQYMVVDHRMSDGLPMVGIYFESGERDTQQHTTPVDPAKLDRFEQLPGMYRIFDSGKLVIYNVGEFSSATP